MIIIFPIWLIAIDYLFGFLMSIFIIKFILNILLPEESTFFIINLFKKITEPIIKFSNKLIPYFIVKPIIPLYLAWLIFMIRIYILPLLLGYSSIGQFSFVFEKDIISSLNSTILNIALYLNYGL
jgi:hypothetical protein